MTAPVEPVSDCRTYRNAATPATCTLCHRPLPDAGQWAWGDGPLCHPDRPGRADCYRQWMDGQR